MQSLLTFIRFSRPHTFVATSLQVMTIFIVVAPVRPLPTTGLRTLFLVWISSLAANLYVVGLNQLTDVAIDKVNKPQLPLAAGDYTRRQAKALTLVSGLFALLVGWWQGAAWLLTLALIMLTGSLYSLPPWRLKQRPFAAAFSIAFARGIIANLGLYAHFSHVLAPAARPVFPLILAASFFFFGFGIVIALYKDIPDWAGDKRYAVPTFAVRWGQRQAFVLGRWLLTALYLLPIAWSFTYELDEVGLALLLIHALALVVFWQRSLQTQPEQPASMMRFYLFLWGLFYLEYVLLSFGGLIAWLRL